MKTQIHKERVGCLEADSGQGIEIVFASYHGSPLVRLIPAIYKLGWHSEDVPHLLGEVKKIMEAKYAQTN
jgi:hypothetical protein